MKVSVVGKDGRVVEMELVQKRGRTRKTERKKEKVERIPAWKERYRISRWVDRTIERFNLRR